MRAKPKKERVNDSVAVRRDFFCAFSAFPASSPSVPIEAQEYRISFSVLAAIPQCFYGFQWGYLAQFLAGSQAEISTVKNESES